ncbi:MAG: hypothetical protein ACQEXJ_13525 [Myxococcota bacterium]
MRVQRLSILVLVLLAVGLAAPSARGQQQPTQDTLADRIASDISALAVNTPIWLSRHLPATMAQTGMGAGIGLSDDAGGFSIGVIPMRLGIFNQFSQVGRGTELIDFESALPGNLPWPQFGVTAGVGLGHGLEVGADIQFIPNMDAALGDEVTVKVGLVSVATALRWRVNEARGGVPALVFGVGGSYYSGKMELGADVERTYAYETTYGGEEATVEGTYSFEGAPRMEWSLWQVNPEVRLGWSLGPFRPYLGFGLGFTFGEVEGGADIVARASVDRVNDEPVDEEPAVYEEHSTLFRTDPARYLMRPHVGFDLVFGIVAITAQLDLAVMNQQKLGGDLGEAAGNFDPTADEGFLYNESSKESETAAALVGTLGLRLQF